MIYYNFTVGNLVKYKGNRFARISDISNSGTINDVKYSLELLKEYPNGEESTVTSSINEITPIGLWGLGGKFWERLGYKNHNESDSMMHPDHQISMCEIVINFPTDITYSIDGYITVGLTKVFLYIIDKTENIIARRAEILEKAKKVSKEEELKAFLRQANDVKFVHDIQNYYSSKDIDTKAEVEKSILRF